MLAINSLLRQAIGSQAATIVHVGAGSGAVLNQYAQLRTSKVVLIEGDPDAGAALQRAARPFPWARIVCQAASKDDGEVTWHRYNLPMLNGPIAADALVDRYPRLHRESTKLLPCVALSTLIRSALDGADRHQAAVLLLDVPGQEGPLLGALQDDLAAFSAVIVRRCALPLPDATDWTTAQEQMRTCSFEFVGHEVDSEPLWPVAVFRLNRAQQERRALHRKVELLTSQLKCLELELNGARCNAKQAAAARADEIQALTIAKDAAERIATENSAVVATLSAQLAEANARAAPLSESESLRTHVDHIVKRECMNVIKQLEAFDAVRAVLGGDTVIPELHGWPISADFAAHLMKLVRNNHFDLVVEFGSGTSTFLLAAALARIDIKSDGLKAVRQVAFEHSPEHLEATREMLRGLGLEAEQIVRAAPLIPYELSTGDVAPYYDCTSDLESVRLELPNSPLQILAVVDGPPGATGPLARLPALDALLRSFPSAQICLLLDDFSRSDEREVVERWKDTLGGIGRTFRVKTLNFEKGACQLEIAANASGS